MVCRVFIKRVDTANPPIQPNPLVPTLFMPTCQWEFFYSGSFCFLQTFLLSSHATHSHASDKGRIYAVAFKCIEEQCESVRFTVFPEQLVQSMSENTVQCKILNSQMQYIQFNTIHTMQCNLIKIQATHRLVICTIQQNSS